MIYTHKEYNELVEETVANIRRLSSLKGGEYAGDTDRLANFRRNAANLDLTMEQVWAVYAGKHWDAINQYVKDVASGKQRERAEPIEGRFDDLIVYAILGKAMAQERAKSTKTPQDYIKEMEAEAKKMKEEIEKEIQQYGPGKIVYTVPSHVALGYDAY